MSNIMLCCKIVLDLIPQVLLIHMIGLYFEASLKREHIIYGSCAILICLIGKAVCSYKTTAGEAGVKFSGGEKQRISIARMILKDAPIIILDEATAAVDPENEVFIQAAINDLSRDKTVIMIAHHLNTIRDVDQIVVMDKGRIVDTGRHETLLNRCGLYRKMAEAQNRVDHWAIKEESI